MLTREQFVGPWAGLPVAWTDDDRFDEPTYRGDVARCCEAGIPGVYTGGTTGEFYAMGFDEFCAVADATIAECHNAGRPAMIGCTATWTGGAIQRARYARDRGADAIQLALPFWLEVPDGEVVRFFEEVSAAVPGMPMTIYETARTKKVLSLELHRRIHDAVPAVIGVKSTGGTLGATPEGCAELSRLYHVFVGEPLIADLGPLGAVGSCSSLVYQNPRIVLGAYELLAARRWEELRVWTDRFHRLVHEGLKHVFAAGCMDSAIDRLLGLSARFLRTSLRCRAPYPSATPELLEGFRSWMRANLPEFLEL
ncbi:MAG TPA: dihydrodipicolinate synthase family protein [Armatimonadota bacterium]|nr:dihydrodipicolinate synthase family protein [Armatimonadota bacterium]